MCGIFGIILKDARHGPDSVRDAMDALFRLSESRGKEAAGVAVLNETSLHVYKEAVRASVMIRRPRYRDLYDALLTADAGPRAVIGHSRLVTTGDQGNPLNNQPVVNSGVVGVHNGIIVNDEALWSAHPDLPRRGRVDSEVIAALLRRSLTSGTSPAAAVRHTFGLLRGAASIAMLFDDLDLAVLATNNGSLYYRGGPRHAAILFASEEYILRQLARRHRVRRAFGDAEILPLRAGEALLVDLPTLALHPFPLNRDRPAENDPPAARRGTPRGIVELAPETPPPPPAKEVRRRAAALTARYEPPVERVFAAIDRLRRCTRCILPETMPFIEFDDAGVCNYCRNYRLVKPRGVEELERLVAPHRRRDGGYDCLVGLSGGRDSTYGLHYLKTVLKMNPVAFTYDWGMVTDLARRNISRICGQLGVEHILVSADIETKRRYIRQNVLAWLKKPALGMIPLFMAGDKQYFFHANRLRRQTGAPLIFLCENMLERTDFKTGFAGVRPAVVDEDHAYTLSLRSKLRLGAYYAGQYLGNPAYLNASVPDTLWAYACYYVIRRDYLNLYRFIEWDEPTIVATLRDQYDWELADDTETTWRIGDGTASFYNYIYHTVAGLNEIYTLRSNQIRQGRLDRGPALDLARRESRPRFDSIRWYLSTIGLGDDFDDVIRIINGIPKLYPV